jgi:hypothetical protein
MARRIGGEPSTAEPADERPLTEALVGGWTSPILSFTLNDDSSLRLHLPDGSDAEGNWSVDSSGQLHAEVMGAPMVGEASLQGDSLTLVMDGQRLVLKRTG